MYANSRSYTKVEGNYDTGIDKASFERFYKNRTKLIKLIPRLLMVPQILKFGFYCLAILTEGVCFLVPKSLQLIFAHSFSTILTNEKLDEMVRLLKIELYKKISGTIISCEIHSIKCVQFSCNCSNEAIFLILDSLILLLRIPQSTLEL